MRTYRILTSLMLRNTLMSMNPFNSSADRKTRRRNIAVALLLGIMLTGAAVFVVWAQAKLYGMLDKIGQPMLLPGMAILVAMAGTLLLGLFQCIGSVYQGKDAPWLAVLPATSRQIFAARLTVLYLTELLLNAVLLLPSLVLYCLRTGRWLPSALTGLAVVLLSPVIPLAIVTLAASLLMRVSGFARHRETVVMVLTLVVSLAYSMGVTFLSNRHPDTPDAEFILKILTQREALLERVLSAFPPALWAARGFIGHLDSLALLAAVSFALTALVFLIAGPRYLSDALMQTEHTAAAPKQAGSLRWASGSMFRALHTLEWRELLRTPAWALNGLTGLVLFPVMFCIGFISGTSSVGTEKVLADLRGLINGVHPGYLIPIFTGILSFGTMINPAVATAVSREGGRYPFAMTLPVPQLCRLRAKLAMGVEINIASTALVTAAAAILLRTAYGTLLISFLLSQIMGFAVAAITLSNDARRPILKWMNETQAIKNNFNSFLSMLLWLLGLALGAGVTVLCWGAGPAVLLAAVIALLLAEGAAGVILLHKAARKAIWLPESI